MLEHLVVWEEASRLRPLRSDADITRRLQQACETMGVNFLDHLIVADGAYFSFFEHRLL